MTEPDETPPRSTVGGGGAADEEGGGAVGPNAPHPASPRWGEENSATPPAHGFVVSHTHWDRAWYLPFERFRLRLVRLVDRVLDLLEGDPAFAAFTLDGQAVLLEDYLAIRPENEGRLRALIGAGRLVVGPWYTLPDLFLVSGEAVVRNLQVGLALCARFGGGMREGYLPDPFGHVAQMPQILRGFGIDSYVFMRGLDAETKRQHGGVFDWRAPDGSTVLAVYQREGYFPAGALGHPSVYGRFDGYALDPTLAREQIEEAVRLQRGVQPAGPVLLSNGFDHMPEQPGLPALLADLDVPGVALEHATLPDFLVALRAATADGTTGDGVTPRGTVTGDLLGNADHPVLRSVNSTRLYLKQQNHAVQSLLTRVVEPLAALVEAGGAGEDARPLLRHAWRLLLQNHPHDDICGCSVDAAHDENEVRYQAVLDLGEELVLEALEALALDGLAPPARTGARPAPDAGGVEEPHGFGPAGPLPTGADVAVWNPLPHGQTVEVEATVLFPNPGGEFSEPVDALPLSAVDAEGRDVPVGVLGTEAPVLRSRYLEGTWGRRYRVRFQAELPPLGYVLVHVFQDPEAAPPRPAPTPDDVCLEASAGGVALVAGGVRLDPLVAFEYALDTGDTYSFGPVPEHGPWAAEHEATETRADGTVVLRHRLRVPSVYSREHGPGAEVEVPIETTVRLRPGGTAALSVAYENTLRDGRLRLVVPTGSTTDAVWADAAFRLARRERVAAPRTPETDPERWAGYPGELDYLTHHQGDFCLVEGDDHVTVVANRGLPEVEVVDRDGETALAVTLHRSVGWLSVAGGRVRRCQAGPQVPTPGAQGLRAVRAEVGVGVARDVSEGVRRGEAFAHPPFVREVPALPYAQGGAGRPRAASALAVEGADVRLSAFKPHDAEAGVTVARVWNAAGAPRAATLRAGWPVAEARRSDLEERWGTAAPLALGEGGAVVLDLGPHQIATVLLRAAPPRPGDKA